MQLGWKLEPTYHFDQSVPNYVFTPVPPQQGTIPNDTMGCWLSHWQETECCCEWYMLSFLPIYIWHASGVCVGPLLFIISDVCT